MAHSTGDLQIPYVNLGRIIICVEDENIVIFTREGDEHFIVYQEYFDNPANDKELSSALLKFLQDNFE